jgi:hypothetical protein
MRRIHIALLSMLLWHGSSRSAGLEGTWFSCNPELTTPSPRNILTIERQDNAYEWQHAWGQHETAYGRVAIVGKELVLSGCTAYRGEKDAKCDEERPPIVLRIGRHELTRKYKSLDFALEGSGWIRVGRISLDELDRRCEEIRDANISKRSAASKR